MPYRLNDASAVAAQAAPREVRLADYAPPAFLVDTLDLTFELDEAATKVTRAPGAAAQSGVAPTPPRRCASTARR